MFRTITKITSVSVCIAAAVFTFAGPVHASVLSFRPTAYAPGSLVERTLNGNAPSPTYSLTDVGVFTNTRTGGDFTGVLIGTSLLPNQFIAWCIEPKETLSVNPTNPYTHTVNPLASGATNIGGMGEVKAQQLNDLFGLFYPDFRAPIADLQAAALQAAVWEIVREAPNEALNIATGDVRYRNPQGVAVQALPLAQTYLDAINAGQHGQSLFPLLALTNGTPTTAGRQDLVVQLFIAEPESLALFAIGGVALAVTRRRFTTPANA